jgi:hypothetical protein
VELVAVSLTRSDGLVSRLQFLVALVIAVIRTSEELKVLLELIEEKEGGGVHDVLISPVFHSLR